MTKTKGNEARTLHRCDCPTCREQPNGVIAREHQAINYLVASVDERNRRLVLGFLASRRGRGGITHLARITGLDRNTIARGQRELLQGDPTTIGRVRRPGAGRKPVEAHVPGS
jgi:DNA-binding phage protein